MSAPCRAQDARIAEQGHAFLKTYCYDCHGGPNDQGTRLTNVLDPKVLLAKPANPKKLPFVTAGDPAKSDVWQRAGKAPFRMPPDDAERQPSEDERKTLEKWFLAGAPFPKATGRVPAFIDDGATLNAIRDHLRDANKVKPADRPFQRYLTLTHLHNNAAISDEQIRIHRAAVSKLLNSLSWQAEITLPRAIDEPARVILNIDLRAYGWNAHDWNEIERAYPYGVQHAEDDALSEVESEIAKLTGTRLPVIRGDWFVAAASRPPLYDRLLRVPANLPELEAKLGVQLEKNFDEGTLQRGGLITSGVSRHNRLVERHRTPFGAHAGRAMTSRPARWAGELAALPAWAAIPRQSIR